MEIGLEPSDSATLAMLNKVLDRIQKMTIQEDLPSAFSHRPFEAYNREFCVPPTTHLVATIDDLTNMRDYNSENAEYMDEEDVATANADVAPLSRGAGRPHPPTIFTWWTPQRTEAALLVRSEAIPEMSRPNAENSIINQSHVEAMRST